MPGTQVGEAYYDLTIDDKDVDKKLDRAGKGMEGLGKIAGVAAIAIAAATAATIAFGVSSVKAFMESEDAIAQTEAVIKSTGGAAGVTAKMVGDLANSLQLETKYSDEAIRSAENMLLTFTNIGKDVFPDATMAVLDMSTAMGTDLTQTAIQVGKALQDPVLGVTALQRVGVRLTEDQKKLIQSLVDVGDTAGAQRIILGELTKEFGGSAKAAGQTLSGQLEILKNVLGEVQEGIGKVIAGALGPMIDLFRDWFDSIGGVDGALQSLSDTFGPMIRAIMDAGKQIGDYLGPKLEELWQTIQDDLIPVMKDWYEKVMIPLWKMLGTGLVIAIGLLIDTLKILIQWGTAAYKAISEGLGRLKETLQPGFDWFIKNIWPSLQIIGQWIAGAFKNAWDGLVQAFEDVNKVFKEAGINIDVMQIALGVIAALLVAAVAPVLVFVGALVGLTLVVAQVISWIAQLYARLSEFASGVGTFIAQLVWNIANWFGQIPNIIANAINWAGQKAADALWGLYHTVIGWINNIVNGIRNAINEVPNFFYSVGRNMIQGLINGMRDMVGQAATVAKDVANTVLRTVKNFLGIRSPSTVFAGLGVNVVEGLAKGMDSATDVAVNAANNLASAVVDNFSVGAMTNPLSPLSTANAYGGAIAASSGIASNTKNIHSDGITVNIGEINNKQDADYVLTELDRKQELVDMGMAAA